MKKIAMQCAALALALAQAAAAASPPPVLTLEASIARAFAANSSLRAAALEVEAQAAALTQAGVLPNPELAFVKEGTHGPERSSTVQLTVPIELGGKRAARIGAARAARDAAGVGLLAARSELRADVGAAFHALAIAAERARLTDELTQLAARSAAAAGRRVVAGKVSPVEETRAKVALAGVRIEALQAARELGSAKVRLAALWAGSAPDIGTVQPLALPKAGAVPQLAALLAATHNAPALRRQHAETELREAGVVVERSKRAPDIGLIVGSQREQRARERQTVVGLSVPLPLFDRNQGAVLASLRRLEAARAELGGQLTRVQADLTDAHARMHSALAEAALIEEQILPGAASAYAAAGKGFEAGKFSFLEVLDAQRSLFQARIQHLGASSQFWRAHADIERLIGPVPLDAATHPDTP